MKRSTTNISRYSFVSRSSYSQLQDLRTTDAKRSQQRATNRAFSRPHVSPPQQQQSSIRPALPTTQISIPKSPTTPPNDETNLAKDFSTDILTRSGETPRQRSPVSVS
ncbi:hypothetical protein K0M31_012699 [Melipona bicolor]|uniref:Uncharacterized protein n=1 Tax=Melipona bicolor TaxID=60889 RepID=A0AA40KH75_9HYME|nr:hypothetical protein K0M31_012699 [Melipona bicolor]